MCCLLGFATLSHLPSTLPCVETWSLVRPNSGKGGGEPWRLWRLRDGALFVDAPPPAALHGTGAEHRGAGTSDVPRVQTGWLSDEHEGMVLQRAKSLKL